MRNLTLIILVFAMVSCCRNLAPDVSIVSPQHDATFESGEKILISVDALDSDGQVAEVRLYINDIGLISLQSFPYNYTLATDEYEAGTYTLKATAIDDEGKSDYDEVNFLLDEGSTLRDYEGNVYETVRIGEQVWMKENLKSTKYSDGSSISLIQDSVTWLDLPEDAKAYCFYDFSENNGSIYGPLYTYQAATNGIPINEEDLVGMQGICPSGWHLPADAEWDELEMFLGMSKAETEPFGWRGSDEGSKLKETGTAHWDAPNDDATNESGFTALPGGHIHTDFMFILLGRRGSWWTATGSGTGGVTRHADAVDTRVNKSGNPPTFAYSVRCVKNE